MISLVTGAAWLACVALTPLGPWLAARAADVTAGWPEGSRPWATLIVFVAGLTLVWESIALPITWQASVRALQLRRRKTDLQGVLRTQLRDGLLGVVLAIVAACVVTGAGWIAGERWWALAGAATLPLWLLAGSVTAVAVGASAPPVAGRPALLARLEALSRQSLGRVIPIREWDDAEEELPAAAVTGLGAGSSILISRSMVRDWPDDEIGVVVAHELSHHVRRDLWRKAVLDALVACVALWVGDRVITLMGHSVSGAAPDLAALPLLGLTVWGMWFLSRPLRFAQSRAHERAADAWAVRVTKAPAALGSAIRRMETRHLAEERPSRFTRWFFHRHPTARERLTAIGE